MEPIDQAFENRVFEHYQAPKEEFTIFTPVLEVIRQQLGTNWSFYEECYKEILIAIRAKEDASAWLSQMNMLVRHDSALAISHEGVLFLLRELERNGSRRFDNIVSPPPSPHFAVPSMPASSNHQPSHQQQIMRVPTSPPSKNPVFLQGPNQTSEAPFWDPCTLTSPSFSFQTDPGFPHARSGAQFSPRKQLSISPVSANRIARGEPIDIHPVKKVAFKDEVVYADYDIDRDGNEFFSFTVSDNGAVYGGDNIRCQVPFPINQDTCGRYDSSVDDSEEEKNTNGESKQGQKQDWEGDIECSAD